MKLFGILIVGLVAGFVLACSRRKKKPVWQDSQSTPHFATMFLKGYRG